MIDLVPNKKRKNHIGIYFNGHLVAQGIDFHNGWYEVRPLTNRFDPIDRTTKMLNLEQIEELCERSYVRYYGKRERFK